MNKEKNFVYKIMKRFVAVVLVAAIVLALSGCAEIKVISPLGRDTILEINNTKCSMGVAMLRLLETKEYYETMEDSILWLREIGDVTMAQYVKNSVKDEMLRYTASQIMAGNLTIYLTDEEIAKAENDAELLLSQLGEIYDLGGYGITREDAVDLYKKKTYYEKVFDKVSENVGMEISNADTKVIQINYAKVPLSVGFVEAEKFRNEIKNSADFRETCDDWGYESKTEVCIKKGEMPILFETVAYALKDNEVSEVVETKDGYYIIQCIEDYMVAESVAYNNEVISDAKRAKFDEAYNKFASESKMRFNSSEWDKISIHTLN